MYQTLNLRVPGLRAAESASAKSGKAPRVSACPAKVVVRCSGEGSWSGSVKKAAALTGATLLPVGAASAAELRPELEKAAETIEKTLEVAQSVAKTAGDAALAAKDLAEKAAPVAGKASEKLSPLTEAVSSFSQRTISPVVNEVVSSSTGAAAEKVVGISTALKDNGVDVAPAIDVAKKLAAETPEVINQKVLPTVQELLKNDPVVLGEYALGAALAYVLLPTVASVLSDVARGYAGDLRAPEALDVLVSDSSALMFDVRLTEEVESKGAIDLSKGAARQLVALERFLLPDRGAYKNAVATEAKLTALKIAALKSTKKRSTLILLDQTGKQSKTIAVELAKLGYSKVFVVVGGFDKWVASKLATKAAFSAATAEVVSAAARKPALSLPGTAAKVEVVKNRGGTKALPSGKK